MWIKLTLTDGATILVDVDNIRDMDERIDGTTLNYIDGTVREVTEMLDEIRLKIKNYENSWEDE